MTFTQKLFRPIDNAPLIAFRIFLGFLLFTEAIGAILTGWVKSIFIKPEFTFSHIGLEWLQPLPGNGMYFYFLTMGILGLLVMLGYRYRLTLGLYTILWAGVYFMQKESYNNHYYLLLLVCMIMWLLPANRYASLDVKRNPAIKELSMPQWYSWVMIVQMAVVYFFATVSKLTPDWVDGTFIKLLLGGTDHLPFMMNLFSKHWFHLFIAWSGMVFDFVVIPLFLWKRTRTIAFICSIIFHIFNSIVLQIGIFPFFALSFIVFFYPADSIRKLFFRKKPVADPNTIIKGHKSLLAYVFVPYFIIQILLPLRHFAIKGDVLWTEEGHRLSWRMMLRQRYGYAQFEVVDKKTHSKSFYPLYRLSNKQQHFATTKPDGIWQMAQRIKKEYAEKGKDVSVFVTGKVAVNDSGYHELVDPKVDMAAAKWDIFAHNDWILLYDEHWKPIP
ncbi:HTTM domain-containing protein [Flavobacterium sp. MAH-1]|uniref:HTTM domain-containing protein n=1 Tax=Flavobacterium agri TaxID=2743471 RepID=A0A7Y9C5G6_9FLAO|nr:HTTM domain-containing protein [Flavobacterium agri]NUY80344.1 HTTM domain-containing protein [Flavobacterium agri]NYA70369.1 HTTM domain-containing protein [Flavobacterium agri]